MMDCCLLLVYPLLFEKENSFSKVFQKWNVFAFPPTMFYLSILVYSFFFFGRFFIFLIDSLLTFVDSHFSPLHIYIVGEEKTGKNKKQKKQEVNNQKNNKNRMRGKFTLNTFTPRSRPLLLSLLMNPANERNEACSNITPSCAGTTREFQWRWMRREGCCVLLLHHQTFFLPLYTQRRAPPPSTK